MENLNSKVGSIIFISSMAALFAYRLPFFLIFAIPLSLVCVLFLFHPNSNLGVRIFSGAQMVITCIALNECFS